MFYTNSNQSIIVIWDQLELLGAANAGGSWSPLGDVTTTILWIGGQITPINIIVKTFLPSLFFALIPLIILISKFKNQKISFTDKNILKQSSESNIILFTGVGLLLFVPLFKSITHLPPFMGMLLALGIIWIVSSFIHLSKHKDERQKFSVSGFTKN